MRHGNDTRIGPDGQDYDPEALRRVSARQRPPRDSKWTSWWGLHTGINHLSVQSSFVRRGGPFAGDTVDQHSSLTDRHAWWGLYPDMKASGDTVEENNAVIYAVHVHG